MAHRQQIVTGVAGRYAVAVHELAKEEGVVAETAEELAHFSTLMDSSEDLKRLVRSPVYSAEEQIAALTAILDAVGIGGVAAKLILLTARNRRLSKIEDIIKAYRALLAQERGEITADVISAETLSPEQLEALKNEIAASLGETVELITHTDPSLIGGLILKYGSKMIDDSLKTKLQNLKLTMKGIG